MNDCEQDDLVRQSQQSDSHAFDELVRRFQNRSVAYARSILHDRESALDVAQEAFLQAWRDSTDRNSRWRCSNKIWRIAGT